MTISKRLVTAAAVAVTLGSASSAYADNCSGRGAELLQKAIYIVADNPGAAAVLATCGVGGIGAYQESQDETTAFAAFGVCAVPLCLFAASGCMETALRAFSLILETTEENCKLSEQRPAALGRIALT